MTLHDITATESIAEHIKQLYFESFPPEERRPWDDLAKRALDVASPLTMSEIIIENKVLGFITWWNFDNFIYVEHFAMNQQVRGNGYGTLVLKLFTAKVKKPVILEVELPDSGEMAIRRIGLYQRCGFKAHPEFHYIQPPYSIDLPPVPLMLMTAGDFTNLDYASQLIHHEVYGYK